MSRTHEEMPIFRCWKSEKRLYEFCPHPTTGDTAIDVAVKAVSHGMKMMGLSAPDDSNIKIRLMAGETFELGQSFVGSDKNYLLFLWVQNRDRDLKEKPQFEVA